MLCVAVVVILGILGLTPYPTLVTARERTCCRYSCEKGNVFCADHCESYKSCVFRHFNGELATTNDECDVEKDSKKDTLENRHKGDEKCLAETFLSSHSFSNQLPFRVVAFSFTESSPSKFVGIDVQFPHAEFTRLRFRLRNQNSMCESLHPGDRPKCHPRCVHVNYNEKSRNLQQRSNVYFSYDCEAGFFIEGPVLQSTEGHDYELSVCEEKQDKEVCGRFAFRLPEVADVEDGEISVMMAEVGNEEDLVVHVPLIPSVSTLEVKMITHNDNKTSEASENIVRVEIAEKNRTTSGMLRLVLGGKDVPQDKLPHGRFQIKVTALDITGKVLGKPLVSSFLTKAETGQFAVVVGVVIVVLILVCVAVFVVCLKLWQAIIESLAVEPRKLVAEGKLQEQTLLVITSLDNPQHVEVVKLLCRYLRTWCGVGTAYFALDDENGIGRGDPWKWCQETGDSVRQTGTIVFIAGPDDSLSRKTSIHPNLEQNQAFLTTVHLQAMAAEGRAVVVRFPYSHLGTLPQEVPDHLKLHAYSLPCQMNDFLLRLLHVPRQALCRLLPIRLVKPDILPADLSREGGPELRDKVVKLSQACDVTTQLRKGSSLEVQEEVGEEQTLLPPLVNTHRDVSLRLELEGTLPSIREMEDRDRLDTESTE